MSHSDTQVSQEMPSLSNFGNVSADYEHRQKLIVPGPDLSVPGAYLKWYDIRPSETIFAPEYIQACREFLQTEVEAGRLNIAQQLGFVELHHCTSVDFLIVSTWRNENELWETAYVRHFTGGGFEYVAGSGHRPVFCVWELGAVCHESLAWARFLSSTRDEQAKWAYIKDRYSGLV